ncbi:MAG TPA: SPOR domain-containing protein [Bdellovibrionales bacterium]|nr:SPOR domain-containing protein [Bdellovibrionales bacterium]
MLNRLKTLFKRPDVYEPKRLGLGRGLFGLLAYFLVFAMGINLGKLISDREYQTQRALSAKMEALQAASPELATERFKRQVAQEIERRVRTQVEEQVKAEIAEAMAPANEAGSESGAPAREPSSLQGRMLSMTPPSDEELAEAPKPVKGKKTKPSAKEKPAAASVFSIELARHATKEDSAESLEELRGKGLKVFQRKIASDDGPSYRVYVGKFEDREKAKAFMDKVLVKKGLRDRAKLRKIDP